jgi:hypothetical protein
MIRGLDKLNPRELIKIGLLYVMSGKEDQRSILANTTRSKQYADFMKVPSRRRLLKNRNRCKYRCKCRYRHRKPLVRGGVRLTL